MSDVNPSAASQRRPTIRIGISREKFLAKNWAPRYAIKTGVTNWN